MRRLGVLVWGGGRSRSVVFIFGVGWILVVCFFGVVGIGKLL